MQTGKFFWAYCSAAGCLHESPVGARPSRSFSYNETHSSGEKKKPNQKCKMAASTAQVIM